MEITTTIGCKVNCAYCPQDKFVEAYHKAVRAPERMTFDAYKTILNKIPLNEIILFSGFAEPWLNPQCTRMILYTHEVGYKIAVNTTAVGMTTSDVEKISGIPFKKFCLHLPDVEGYAKITLNENYLKTLEAIIKGNIRNCDFMAMGTLPPSVRIIIGKRHVFPTKMLPRAGNLTNRNDVTIPHRLKGPIRCSRSLTGFSDHNIVLPNGDVVLCCNDFGLQHVLGNLITSDYNALFTRDTYKLLRLGQEDDAVEILCRRCEYASSPIGSRILYLKHVYFNAAGFIIRYCKW